MIASSPSSYRTVHILFPEKNKIKIEGINASGWNSVSTYKLNIYGY